MVHKISSSGFIDTSAPSHQLLIPFMKFWSVDDNSVVSEKSGDKIFEKVKLKYS